MNYLKFIYEYNFYHAESCSDSYLNMLSEVFDEGANWIQSIQKELLKLDSQGITGNKTDVTIKGSKVIIEPLFTETPKKWTVEIDRDVLLALIAKWQELAQKNAQEITFTHHEDGNITIEGTFLA